jgi:hypothetical protein
VSELGVGFAKWGSSVEVGLLKSSVPTGALRVKARAMPRAAAARRERGGSIPNRHGRDAHSDRQHIVIIGKSRWAGSSITPWVHHGDARQKHRSRHWRVNYEGNLGRRQLGRKAEKSPLWGRVPKTADAFREQAQSPAKNAEDRQAAHELLALDLIVRGDSWVIFPRFVTNGIAVIKALKSRRQTGRTHRSQARRVPCRAKRARDRELGCVHSFAGRIPVRASQRNIRPLQSYCLCGRSHSTTASRALACDEQRSSVCEQG